MALAAAVAYLVLAPRTADLAAAVYRADLFSDHPWALWNGQWYGGHHTLGYSVAFPPLAALVGPRVVGVLAAIAAAALFERVVVREFGSPARLGALLFALAMAANLFAARLTFTLGLAFALGAVAAAQAQRRAPAIVLAALTPLASPVAAAFLALASLAWAIATPARRGAGVALAVAALAATGVLALAFPEGGSQPFPWSAYWPIAGFTILALVTMPRDRRALRTGVVLYGAASTVAYLVATPMGGNAVRLGALFGLPLLACTLWPRRRLVLAVLAIGLLWWQWQPVKRDLEAAAGDPATHAAYYEPLLAFLERRRRANGPLRVEIPFTRDHWETAYVARRFPLARGWERQLDVRYNGLFYTGGLTAARYLDWLRASGVGYVALPDAQLDFSAQAEARLLRAGAVAGLTPVWSSRHWQVWKAPGAALATTALTSASPESFALDLPRPARVTVRVRFTPYWAVTFGAGCVARAAGGWTEVRARRPGPLRVGIRFALDRVLDHGARCSG